MLPQLIAVIGATGTGKTEFSLDISEELISQGHGVEIVNADAMQLYQGMDIGTAKIPLAQRRGISHHLLDIAPPSVEVTVSEYQGLAREVVEQINARGNIALLVGGSGLYVSSVLFDFAFPGHDENIREKLENELEAHGSEALYQRLKQLSPETALRIDGNNPRRVVRALEVIEMTGDTAALGTLPEQPVFWKPTIIFGLKDDREALVKRLDDRVVQMWSTGLVDEVQTLIPQGIETGVTARRAIGYSQALAYLSGEMTEAEAIEQTQLLTRRFARRQVSWFKRYPGVHWLSVGNPQNIAHALDIIGQ